jgi:hypothetical protein
MSKKEPAHDPRIPSELSPVERMLSNYTHEFLGKMHEDVTLELRLPGAKAIKILEYLAELEKDSGFGKE